VRVGAKKKRKKRNKKNVLREVEDCEGKGQGVTIYGAKVLSQLFGRSSFL
jgi:hypothetical protein